MTNPEEHDLEPVFEGGTDETAQIVIEFLEANGIQAFENSNLPHSIYPVLGDAQVLVNKNDAEKARQLLKAREDVSASEADEEE